MKTEEKTKKEKKRGTQNEVYRDRVLDNRKKKIKGYLDNYKRYRSIGVVASKAGVSKQYVSAELLKDDEYKQIKESPLDESAIVQTFLHFDALDPHSSLPTTAKQYRRHHKIGQTEILEILQNHGAIAKDPKQLEDEHSILLCAKCGGVVVPWGTPKKALGTQYRCTQCNSYSRR